MTPISVLIDVFKMDDLSIQTRVRLLKKLGIAINDQMGMNITEPIVYELVRILDKDNPLLREAHYVKFI